LTGRLPFAGQSDVETLHRIAHDDATAPSAVNAAVPAAVDAAVRRALSKSPADRFASAAEFAQALGSPLGQGFASTLSMPAAAPPQPAAAARGRRAPLAAAALAVLALLLAGGWWAWRGNAREAGAATEAARSSASLDGPWTGQLKCS